MTTHTNIVDNHLYQKGFSTKRVTSDAIRVSLNRKVKKMEVETALLDSFDEELFETQQSGDNVLVFVIGE